MNHIFLFSLKSEQKIATKRKVPLFWIAISDEILDKLELNFFSEDEKEPIE